jgi:hypothetical protein
MISLAVVILVVVGYDLLMKVAKRKQIDSIKQLDGLIDDYYNEQQAMSNLKTKINETESTNSEQPKKSKSKSKTK